MKKSIYCLFCLIYLQPSFAQNKEIVQISPNKQLRVACHIDPVKGVEYSLLNYEKVVVDWSPLGFVLEDHDLMGLTYSVSKVETQSVNEHFAWPFGENAQIQNAYNGLQVTCQMGNNIHFIIEARVYNNSIAFRCQLPKQASLQGQRIIQEKTAFRFTHSFLVYRHNAESEIIPVALNALQNATDFPATLTSENEFISINEAGNDMYTKALLGKGETPNSLVVQFSKDTVKLMDDFHSPWRTITLAANASELCNSSDLLFKLCPPAPVSNYDWIKPGKLIRDMTLSTEGAVACIDFAEKMHFQYVMFDAGWYGKGYAAEFDQSSNPRNVVKAIDMPKVIGYGQSKKIGLILYVNYVGLRKYDMDSSFTLYKSWGVKGLKFGFVNGLTQDGILWLMKAVKKAQDYGFIIDIHDNYKPTGLSRTYPALLTQEGVRGNENNPDAIHNTTLPFTRFLSGPADYTFCYRNQNDSFNNSLLSKKLQVSKGQQLALTVIFYSPIQSMLWYGRPADYKIWDEIEFFSMVPTTWDKTLHLQGEIGKHVLVARKKGNDWFVGAAAGNESFDTQLDFSFLDKNKNYVATIYADDGKGGILKKTLSVNQKSSRSINIVAKGGEALVIKLVD